MKYFTIVFSNNKLGDGQVITVKAKDIFSANEIIKKSFGEDAVIHNGRQVEKMEKSNIKWKYD